MPHETDAHAADAQSDFSRQRRRAEIARLIGWLRRQPDDVGMILPFDEVVTALGRTGERRLGVEVIRVETIVGSVDRTRDFDRYFRPTSARTRERWQRMASAWRSGQSMPPIEVYRIGSMHFVIDGHHRVSVAFAMHNATIEANVTEIATRISPDGITTRGDLVVKDHRRLFLTRVPLVGKARDAIEFTDPWQYSELSEAVEAWGFRLMQEIGQFVDRPTVARRWFGEEFLPVVRMVRSVGGMLTRHTDAEAFLWVARERYRLVRSHTWNEEIMTRLKSTAPE